jgi:hypothetical protein
LRTLYVRGVAVSSNCEKLPRKFGIVQLRKKSIDKPHPHILMYYNSTTIDCMGKFRDFLGSAKAVRRLSDRICYNRLLAQLPNAALAVNFPHFFVACSLRTLYVRGVAVSSNCEKLPRKFGIVQLRKKSNKIDNFLLTRLSRQPLHFI